MYRVRGKGLANAGRMYRVRPIFQKKAFWRVLEFDKMANFWRVLEFDKFAGEWPLLKIYLHLIQLVQLITFNLTSCDQLVE